MVECPWCAEQVELVNDLCPACKQEVLPEHLIPYDDEAAETEVNQWNDQADSVADNLDISEIIANRFKCSKCGHRECRVKEVAMTGVGLSKLLDIQHHHYLFVSCENCGFVEVYDSSVLRGKKAGKTSTILDILWGY